MKRGSNEEGLLRIEGIMLHLGWGDCDSRCEGCGSACIEAFFPTVRSAKAVNFLQQAAFKKVHNLAGGILAWADRVDPRMPKY